MAKFYVENSNDKTIVKCKLDWLEQFRNEDIETFNETIIRGLLKPALKGFRTVEYYVPAGIPLQQFLKNGLKKEDFFNILVQILEVIKKVSHNGLTVNNICLDLGTTFINEYTGEVHFVYAPIRDPKKNINIKAFLSDMAYSTVFDLHEDVSFINNLVEYMNNIQDLSIQDIERYVVNVCPEVYDSLNIDINNTEGTKDCSEIGAEVPINPYSEVKTKEVLDEDNDELRELIRIFEDKTVLPVAPNETSDSILKEEDEQTVLLDEDESTVFLDDDDTTVFLDETTELLEKEKKIHIYLIRVKNCEQIDIKTPSFIIGKDEYRSNYAVTDNGAVSRIHAEISCIEGRYFIRDNSSTNGTFVNEELLEKGSTSELFDGDEIILGNECFEFHIDTID